MKFEEYTIEQHFAMKDVLWKITIILGDTRVASMFSDDELTDEALRIAGKLMFDHIKICDQFAKRRAKKKVK